MGAEGAEAGLAKGNMSRLGLDPSNGPDGTCPLELREAMYAALQQTMSQARLERNLAKCVEEGVKQACCIIISVSVPGWTAPLRCHPRSGEPQHTGAWIGGYGAGIS